MRILYSAIDQVVPGTKGGSVHVTSVAEGLAALGHEVHVLVTPGDSSFPSGPVRWIPMSPPAKRHQLRWMRSGAVRRIAQELQPDVIMERYYNFGGEAILHARRLGALAVLEVNAPVVDHPGSRKAALDRALVVRPMQRWRERICAAADVIVSPAAGILPADTPRAKILELEWGADTARFRPGVRGALPFTPPPGIVAVFAGAFRSWHGAISLAHAVRRLRERGRQEISALFIGDGPELPAVRDAAAGLDGVVFAGALPHGLMPAALGAAHIGVAPFDIAAHKPLSLGFYWSPLKMFEYMAAGLPVVAPAVARIPALVGHEREGILYDPADPAALASALARLADGDLRVRLGAAARERAVAEYSWSAHCAALDAAFRARRPA
jgi:glycosyltransferase involved in cell wall biosynthesis